MTDYIDRTTLKIAINDYEESHGTMSSMALWKCINEQPSVDAVKVVRCKDCKHSVDHFVYGCWDGLCCEELGGRLISDNDFCKWGEKE